VKYGRDLEETDGAQEEEVRKRRKRGEGRRGGREVRGVTYMNPKLAITFFKGPMNS
jgi:hypothetical protein